MRKNATKLAALALTLAMTVTSVALPSSASAATKTVKLNTTSKTLYATGSSAKKTTTLKVTVNGKKKTATFKSSNTKVATVGKTSGKVTAKKAGKATITATYGGKKVTCKITVKAKFVKVKSVSVSPKTVSLAVGKTKTIKTTVKPSNASIKKVTYASDKKSVATVTSAGKITAKKAGTAKVTVTATDGTKKKATVTVKVTKATTPTATPSTEPTTAPTPTATPAQTATSASATAITSFKATGAAKLTAEFSGAVSTTAVVKVTKDGKEIESKAVTFNEKRTSAVFESKGKFITGEYVITVTDGDKKFEAKTNVEAEKLVEIKIKDSVALTGVNPRTRTAADANGKENTEAYIYYDALNQYGESMRESTDINWTISSSTKNTVDKTTGRITIENAKTTGTGPSATTTYDSYTYGTDIYVVGVNVKYGINVNKSVKIGMAQAIDKVEFKGFVDTKSTKKEFLQELPKNFENNRYELCYAALDQNGNQMEAVYYEKTNLTLLADKPLVVKSEFEKGKLHTVDGVTYASVKIQPGDYVDNGASVTFTMISNKTGTKTEKIYNVGAAAKLKSLTIQAPTGVVADGDKDVELKYVAVDTNGNETESYETIVRSTNALTLAANPGTIKISESDSGKAVIKWSDEDEYAKLDGAVNPYTLSDTWNGQPRVVAISTIVAGIGGESKNMTFEVSDIRRPKTISHVKLNGDDNNAIVSGNNATIDFIGSDDVTYIDQYNEKLSKEKVEAFFKASNASGIDSKRYAIEVKTASSADDTKNLWNTAVAKKYLDLSTTTSDKLTYNATLGDRASVDAYNAAAAAYDVENNKVIDANKKLAKLNPLKDAQTAAGTSLDAVAFPTGIADDSSAATALTTKALAVAEADKLKPVVSAAVTALADVEKFKKAAKDTIFEDEFTAVESAVTPVKNAINAVTDALYTAVNDASGANASETATAAATAYAALYLKVKDVVTTATTLKNAAITNFKDATGTDPAATNKTVAQEVTAVEGAKTTAQGNIDGETGLLATMNDKANAAKAKAERSDVVIKYTIVEKPFSATEVVSDDKYSAVSKTDTEEYTVLPILEVRDRMNLAFKAAKLNALGTATVDAASGAVALADDYGDDNNIAKVAIADISNVKDFNDKAIGEFEVKATTNDGKVVTIPSDEYHAGGAASQLLNDKEVVTALNATNATDKLLVKDFYNYNDAKNIRKDATAKLVVDVYGTKLSKSIAVSAATPSAKEVKFTYKKKVATKGVVNPTNTKIATLTTTKKVDETDELRYVVLDQYNCPIDKSVSMTISDIKESLTELTHLVNTFAPVQNGTSTASVDKAEIGDNYKLTVAVDGTTVSGSVDVTVGSDKEAYITEDAPKQDETFRKTFLGMTR